MRMSLLAWGVSAALAVSMAGCVVYRPAQLPTRSDLKTSVGGLTLPGARLVPLPATAPRTIHPHAPLDPTDAAILAVLNDPALQARRARRGVAAAELFAAGLLPDPVLQLTRIRPTGGGGGGGPGSSLAAGEALVPLVTRGDRIRAAQAHLHEVDLALLWKGWQVAQRARWLVSEIVAERQLRAAEAHARETVNGFQAALRHLKTARDASAAELAQTEALLGKLTSDSGTTERKLNDAEQHLHALLDLKPAARLRLRVPPAPQIATAAIASALQDLPRRRPDLLALAAGFRSKDESLRAAIAAQFPAITLSFLRESDVEGVTSVGIGVALRLPFFNGNRGAIRKAEADRASLRATYQARLDRAVGDVSRLEGDHRILEREVAGLKSQQLLIRSHTAHMQRLAKSGVIDQMEALQLEMQWYHARRREITAELALRKTSIALETMLGVPADRLTRSSQAAS